LIAGLIVLAIYAHGMFRPSIRTALEAEYLFLNETDAFNPTRETGIALRFLSWILGAVLVHRMHARVSTSAAKANLETLAKVLGTCLALSSLGLIADHIFPSVRVVLGRLYGFDPGYVHWADRAYGFFASPVEAGAALVFGALLLVIANRGAHALSKPWLAATLLLTATGLLLTKALTPFLGLVVAAGIVCLARLSAQKLKKLALIAVPAAVAGVAALSLTFEGQMKLINLARRIGPWRIYVSEAFSRADTALIGFGFAPYHTDNFFLFLFTRGGLLTLGVFLLAIAAYARRNTPRWSEAQNLILVYLFVTGLTTDALIFRHVVFLLIAVGIPLLASAHEAAVAAP
ncbi:MAG: hypothetical protein HYW49_03385, partial [Deltaproteobacteria bacterium]|nr:hypothetical protein [Deltaproteobacteria bacterium]